MKTLEISKTILDQLGGRKFIAMTGSTNFMGGENYLSFKLTTNKIKATHLRITLTENDTYTLEFFRFRGTKVTNLNKIETVYFDQLQEIFTDITGLLTHL